MSSSFDAALGEALSSKIMAIGMPPKSKMSRQ
jgi:hypothetical protein